jgi:hypothetical protein
MSDGSFEREMAHRGRCIQAVPSKSNRESWGANGSAQCPDCSGTIKWARARYSGRLYARCSTPQCFAVEATPQ